MPLSTDTTASVLERDKIIAELIGALSDIARAAIRKATTYTT